MILDGSTSLYVSNRQISASFTRDVSDSHKHIQEYDLRNTQSIEEAVRHSDVVYNLVGRQYPTKFVDHISGGAESLLTDVQELLVHRCPR